MNKPEEAAEIYNNIYTQNPSSFKNFANYGLALYRISDYENAEDMLKKAAEKDKNDAAAIANLAYVYLAQQKYDDALSAFQKALEIQPELSAARFDYANLLADRLEFAQALEEYNEYLKEHKDNPDAYLNAGIIYEKTGKYSISLFKNE